MKELVFAAIGAAATVAGAGIVTQDIDGGQALVVSGTAFSPEELVALNDNVVKELWKTGDATLAADGISGFAGVIRAKGGIYKVAAQTGLGTTVIVR